MKVLCQNCGFNNIYSKKKSHREENFYNTANPKNNFTLKSICRNSSYEIEASILQKKARSLNNSCIDFSKSFFRDDNQNNSKSIAGILAMSVGSIDLSNPTIDIIFKRKGKLSHDELFNLNINIDEKSSHYYLNLKECKSGLEKIFKNGKSSLLFEFKNQSKSKLNISSNSLDKYIETNKDILDSSSSFLFQDLNDRVIFDVSFRFI